MAEVQTKFGPVKGLVTRARVGNNAAEDRAPVRRWLSIPYAHAERWKLPEDPPSWREPRDCSDFKSAFPDQGSVFDLLYAKKERRFSRDVPYDEHSHFVCIWAPGEKAPAKPLPVIVWIHGGALYFGNSAVGGYDAAELVRKAETDGSPVIVVSIQYRLSILGWLANQDLLDVEGRAGNFGLYDSIKALEWVQQNIAAFGGDPEQVTVVGQSAGANIAHCLFRTGKKLFQRAILMSGAAGVMMERPVDGNTFPGYEQLLKDCEISAQTPKERIEALRALPSKEIVDKAFASLYAGLWHPVVEHTHGALFNKTTWNTIKEGDYDPWIKGVIFGLTPDEGTLFQLRLQVWTAPALEAVMQRRGFEAETSKVISLYPLDLPNKELSNLPALGGTHFVTDSFFVAPSIAAARDLARTPNKQSGKKAKTWVYRIDAIPSHLYIDLEKFGRMHTCDLPFLFNNENLWEGDASSDDAKVTDAFLNRILSFVQTGNPDSQWPSFEEDSLLVFQGNGQVSQDTVQKWTGERLEFCIGVIQNAMDKLDAGKPNGKL